MSKKVEFKDLNLNEIDISRLTRDYIKYPLKPEESPSKNDLEYLFIELNWSRKELAAYFNRGRGFISNLYKRYGICKTQDQINKKIDKTFKERWGCNPSSTPEVKEKIEKHFIEKYGSRNPWNWPGYKDHYNKICQEKYGGHPMHNPQIKEKQIRALKKTYATGEPQLKRLETMRKIGWLEKGFSRLENEAFQFLCSIFSPSNIIRQYRSLLYPFNCDFYLKDQDMYIECHFSQFHNKEPFNPCNPVHKEKVEKIKNRIKLQKTNMKGCQYEGILYTWTIDDPKKAEIAKKNNLNWKAFYTLDELKNYFNEAF